jgi:hypothetical protein
MSATGKRGWLSALLAISVGACGGGGKKEDLIGNGATTAFRFDDLALRDPHVFINFGGCHDVTDQPFFGFALNDQFRTRIRNDQDGDGNLDINLIVGLTPADPSHDQVGFSVLPGTCPAPFPPSGCTATPNAMPSQMVAHNMPDGTCGTTIAGTLFGYSPAVILPSGRCFGTDSSQFTLDMLGTQLVLSDAQFAGVYFGDPPNAIMSGYIRGFLSESAANTTLIPAAAPLVGGRPISTVLAGGQPPGANPNCASHDDRDQGPGGVRGWYFYLNFSAAAITYSP